MGQGANAEGCCQCFCLAVFFTLLGVCLVPQGRQTVWDMLAGGDGEGARQIASMLQRSLSEGEAAAVAAWAVFREAIGKLG